MAIDSNNWIYKTSCGKRYKVFKATCDICNDDRGYKLSKDANKTCARCKDIDINNLHPNINIQDFIHDEKDVRKYKMTCVKCGENKGYWPYRLHSSLCDPCCNKATQAYHENNRKEKAKEAGVNLDMLQSVFENGRTLYNSNCTDCGIDTGLKRFDVLLKAKHLCKSCNGKGHLGKIVSEETKILMKKNNHLNNGGIHPFLGKCHSEKSKQVLSEQQSKYCKEYGGQFKGKKHSQETKALLSQKNANRPPRWKGRVFQYDGPNGKFKMRSSYELLYATFLDDNSVAWKYEPQFKLNDGRIFSPDFELIESGTIVEVKGYWTPKGLEKWCTFCKDYSNLPKVIIDKHDLIGLGLEIRR